MPQSRVEAPAGPPQQPSCRTVSQMHEAPPFFNPLPSFCCCSVVWSVKDVPWDGPAEPTGRCWMHHVVFNPGFMTKQMHRGNTPIAESLKSCRSHELPSKVPGDRGVAFVWSSRPAAQAATGASGGAEQGAAAGSGRVRVPAGLHQITPRVFGAPFSRDGHACPSRCFLLSEFCQQRGQGAFGQNSLIFKPLGFLQSLDTRICPESSLGLSPEQ